MSVHRCDYCGSWRDGATTRPADAPRDQYGRIERGYEGPRFCDSHCRDHAAHGVNPDEHDPIRCSLCLAVRANRSTARRTAAQKGASHRAH